MQNSQLDNFKILRTLGSGVSSKVKLGENIYSGQKYALKILKSLSSSRYRTTLIRECNIMGSLSHKNILSFYDLNLRGKYISKSGSKKEVIYGIIEFAKGGELFEILYNSNAFNENLTLFYAKQLFNTLLYIHKKGIVHRDLKPENLLLDKNYVLKLADFGFSTIVKGEKKNSTFVGSPQVYMAPEIHLRKNYNAKKADVFSAGIVIFILRTKKFPFGYCRFGDKRYDEFVKTPEKFWNRYNDFNFSKEFKTLINGMIESNPKKRFSMKDVLNSDWINKKCDKTKALNDIKIKVEKIQIYIKSEENSVDEFDLSEKTQDFSDYDKDELRPDFNFNERIKKRCDLIFDEDNDYKDLKKLKKGSILSHNKSFSKEIEINNAEIKKEVISESEDDSSDESSSDDSSVDFSIDYNIPIEGEVEENFSEENNVDLIRNNNLNNDVENNVDLQPNDILQRDFLEEDNDLTQDNLDTNNLQGENVERDNVVGNNNHQDILERDILPQDNLVRSNVQEDNMDGNNNEQDILERDIWSQENLHSDYQQQNYQQNTDNLQQNNQGGDRRDNVSDNINPNNTFTQQNHTRTNNPTYIYSDTIRQNVQINNLNENSEGENLMENIPAEENNFVQDNQTLINVNVNDEHDPMLDDILYDYDQWLDEDGGDGYGGHDSQQQRQTELPDDARDEDEEEEQEIERENTDLDLSQSLVGVQNERNNYNEEGLSDNRLERSNFVINDMEEIFEQRSILDNQVDEFNPHQIRFNNLKEVASRDVQNNDSNHYNIIEQLSEQNNNNYYENNNQNNSQIKECDRNIKISLLNIAKKQNISSNQNLELSVIKNQNSSLNNLESETPQYLSQSEKFKREIGKKEILSSETKQFLDNYLEKIIIKKENSKNLLSFVSIFISKKSFMKLILKSIKSISHMDSVFLNNKQDGLLLSYIEKSGRKALAGIKMIELEDQRYAVTLQRKKGCSLDYYLVLNRFLKNFK